MSARLARHPLVVACALFAFALLVRVLAVALTSFDGLYGQDAFAYYDYALDLWQRAHALQPPAPFWWPLGYPALSALAFGVVGFSPFAAQLVSLLCGALVAPLVFAWTRELAGGDVVGPLLAGVTAALCGELLQLSISIMSDTTALMWALVSVLALLRYTRDVRARWWVLSLLSLTLAALTRWVYGALLAPWLIAFALTWWRAGRRTPALAHALAGIVLPLPLAFVQSGALISSTSLSHAWLVGWNPANAFGRVFDTPDGHIEYALPVAAFYAQPLAHPYYLFPLLSPLVLIGAWALRRAPLAQRVSLFGWLSLTFGFLAGIPYENFRFGLSLFPPLLVLAGVGANALSERWRAHPLVLGSGQRAARNLERILPLASSVVVLISLFGMGLWSVRGVGSFVSTKNEQLAVVRWAEPQLAPGSTLLVFELTEYFSHYAPELDSVELYSQTPESLPEAICAAPSTALLVDVEHIDAQWTGLAPALNLRWLQTHTQLDERGKYGTYTLFHVSGGCP